MVIDTILGKIQPESPAGGARSLLQIIGDVSRRGAGEVRGDAILGDDLDLDSLGRVELLSAIEAEFGVASRRSLRRYPNGWAASRSGGVRRASSLRWKKSIARRRPLGWMCFSANGRVQSDRGALVLRDDRWRIRHDSGLRCLARAPNPIAHLWGQWADTVLRGVT